MLAHHFSSPASLLEFQVNGDAQEQRMKEMERERKKNEVSEVRVEVFSFDSIPSSRIISCKCIEYIHTFRDMASIKDIQTLVE